MIKIIFNFRNTLMLFVLLAVNVADAQNDIYNPILYPNNKVKLLIKPIKKLIRQKDEAMFKFKITNCSDSVFYFHKYHKIVEDFNNELRGNFFETSDITLDLLIKSDTGYIEQSIPYTTNIETCLDEMIDTNYLNHIHDSISLFYKDSLMEDKYFIISKKYSEAHSNYISKLHNLIEKNYNKMEMLKQNDVKIFIVNLFPMNERFQFGKYKVRANIRLNFDDIFFIVRSNWVEFIFK